MVTSSDRHAGERPLVRVRSSGAGRAGPRLIGLLFAVTVFASVVRGPSIIEDALAFRSGPAGLMIYVDPTNGWRLQFPSSWHGQRFSNVARGRASTLERHGVILSNIDHHFEDRRGKGIGWLPWFDMSRLPSNVVAVQIMFSHGGGFHPVRCLHDTPLPLSLDHNAASRGWPEAEELRVLERRFSVGGIPQYTVTAWIGTKASREDLALLDGVVGSIRYEATGDPTYGVPNCMEFR